MEDDFEEQRTLRTFAELTTRLLDEAPLEDILRIVTDAAIELLPGEHASVRVLDESGTKLLCGVRSGAGASEKPMTFEVGEGIIGWAVKHGCLARVNDARTNERFKPAERQGFEVRSLLAVPIRSAGHVLGVLGITSPHLGTFTGEHEPVAVLLANCVAPIIEKARLARLALLDQNTLAFNQRYLFPRLGEEINRARRYGAALSIMLMDLDRFKNVNDTHGHATGDIVLQTFTDRVRSAVRLSDVLIRRGGDEFVLIAPNTGLDAAGAVAERIRAGTITDPVPACCGVVISQTVSIGVVQWDGDEDEHGLEARADQAMYEAKRRGRNQVVVAPAGNADR
jgi:diguanylate cyclase (GGDEF)-like protein